jgi:chromosome segregation ATPase
MNAMLREKYEVTVLTNEAIEVHLSYLRPAVESMQAELPAVRQEIKALDEKLTGKIDAQGEMLTGKIDAQGEMLNGKIDAQGEMLNGKIDALGDKLDKLSERVLEMQGNQKGLILFLTLSTLIFSGFAAARQLNWI